MTTLDYWCQFRGQQGGTIHNALADFKDLPMGEKDRFCGILVDNLRNISDITTAKQFMNIRLSECGL